jgi:hypothetical protein
MLRGLPVANYTGMLSVKPNGAGSSVEWRAQFLPNGQGTIIVKTIVSTLFKTGYWTASSLVSEVTMTEAAVLDSECSRHGR